VTYLNAADVFVLPTLGEGCCNAIVEAMACGLPIISSDRPFNYDILNADNSIMVEPENIEAIAAAIHSLYIDSCKRQRLSEGSLLISNNLKLENRARRICEFIYEHLRR
jgi:glycosyltransferase involved in cell wall biosynthesis